MTATTEEASVPVPARRRTAGRLPAGDLLDRYCDGCADVTTFEVPLCADGHEGDCPELVCTGCGHAVLAGVAALGGRDAGRAASGAA